MNVTLCDTKDCTDRAFYHVAILEGDWQGLEFDSCEKHLASKYVKGLR